MGVVIQTYLLINHNTSHFTRITKKSNIVLITSYSIIYGIYLHSIIISLKPKYEKIREPFISAHKNAVEI